MNMTKTEAKQTALVTFAALGGMNKLQAMVGADNFSYGNDGAAAFKFKMCSKANTVKFEVTGEDLYTVTFYNYDSECLNFEPVKVFDGLWIDQIRQTFEEYTGLYLTLGTLER